MASSSRLFSVDLFRGVTIAGMLVVNNPGSWSEVYAPLLHARWEGCTPTDLVFPFFLFIVGVVLPIALGKRMDRGDSRTKLFGKILTRTLIIVGLGLFLSAFPDFDLRPEFSYLAPLHYALLSMALLGLLLKEVGENFAGRSPWGAPVGRYGKWAAWSTILGMVVMGYYAYDLSALRWPGVLQRIGIVYGICATLFLFVTWRGQTILAVVLLAGYWLWMCYLPMPDGSAPVLEPSDNWAARIDRQLLAGHMWSQTKTWDPEGLFSTLPAIATCLLGMLLGRWLQSGHSPQKQLGYTLVAGLALLLIGLVWSLDFPMIKALWTSSYVLYSAGWACLVFGLLYWISDMRGRRRWAIPLVAFGMNALFAYILSSMLAKVSGMTGWAGPDGEWQSTTAHLYLFFAHLAAPKLASLAVALTHLLVVWLPISLLYRYRVFIKV